MASSAFDQKNSAPDDRRLTEVLRATKAHWDAIVAFAHGKCGALTSEWKFYGKKFGWQMKLSHKKRAMLYLVPREGSFLAAMALGPAAVSKLRSQRLPIRIVRAIEEEKVAPEGRPARVEVHTEDDAEIVMRLLALKTAE
jgi:hypothetical protein